MPSMCIFHVNVSLHNFDKINLTTLIKFPQCKGKIQGHDFRQIRSLLSISLSQVSYLTSSAKARALGSAKQINTCNLKRHLAF